MVAFINADGIIDLNGDILSYNQFVYCMNNFVNRFDVCGGWSMPNWTKVTIGVVAIAGLTVASGATSIAPKANAHGSTFHKIATNMETGNMAASGKYSEMVLINH